MQGILCFLCNSDAAAGVTLSRIVIPKGNHIFPAVLLPRDGLDPLLIGLSQTVKNSLGADVLSWRHLDKEAPISGAQAVVSSLKLW